MSKGPISHIEKHYLHFNSAALVDAAKGYEEQLANGAKMMVTCWSNEYCRNRKDFAEMIRHKVQIISCTGANLEEDIMNLLLIHITKECQTTVI
jgi:deoxyhypusine synthase